MICQASGRWYAKSRGKCAPKLLPSTKRISRLEASVKPEKKEACRSPKDSSREHVRQSWKDSVKVLLTVPPGRRQHVIGPRGDTIQKLKL